MSLLNLADQTKNILSNFDPFKSDWHTARSVFCAAVFFGKKNTRGISRFKRDACLAVDLVTFQFSTHHGDVGGDEGVFIGQCVPRVPPRPNGPNRRPYGESDANREVYQTEHPEESTGLGRQDHPDQCKTGKDQPEKRSRDVPHAKYELPVRSTLPQDLFPFIKDTFPTNGGGHNFTPFDSDRGQSIGHATRLDF